MSENWVREQPGAGGSIISRGIRGECVHELAPDCGKFQFFCEKVCAETKFRGEGLVVVEVDFDEC